LRLIIAGTPGAGKSTLTCDLAAPVSRGADWPAGEGKASLGRVLKLTGEDNLKNTAKLRLIAAAPGTFAIARFS
jgi:hypothetical protein